jgi:hypothetical protein
MHANEGAVVNNVDEDLLQLGSVFANGTVLLVSAVKSRMPVHAAEDDRMPHHRDEQRTSRARYSSLYEYARSF